MALDSKARQAEDGYLLVLGLAKDRRLLTGSADEVHLLPTGATSLDEIALLVNDPPGSAEDGHGSVFGFVTTTTMATSGFVFVTTTATAGSDGIFLLVATTPTVGSAAEDEHELVTTTE